MKKILILLFIPLFLCNGCRTIEQTNIYKKKEKIDTYRKTEDSTYLSKQTNTICWLHDSIYIKEKGDTVFIKEWHTKFIDNSRIDTFYSKKIDTLYINKSDTCYIDKTSTVIKKEVPKWILYILSITGTISIITITKIILKLKR